MKTHTEIIRGLREDNDLNQVDVAKLLHVKQQQYSNYESGISNMSIQSLSTLADYYNVSTDYLLGRTSCKDGILSLKETIVDNYTSDDLLSDVLSLNSENRKDVIKYLELLKFKQTTHKK